MIEKNKRKKKRDMVEIASEKNKREKNKELTERGEKNQERKLESFYARESEVKRALSSNRPLLVLLYKEACFSTNELNPSLPSVVVSLLQDFEDVFPKEMPKGLPPIRGIEHQIDFIPGAAIPNKPTYRSNPEETKELQKQVGELMEMGYISESMSPCAVPVLLVPKKDGTWRMCVDF